MHYCLYLSRSENAAPYAQNVLPVVENPKQDLVGRLHCRVKGEFYNDRTRIYTTLYSKGRTTHAARHMSLRYFFIIAHAQSFQFQGFNPIKCLHALTIVLERE